MVGREVVRGVSGVSWDTPIFQHLLYEFQQKNVSKILRIIVGYPNIKILTSSLLCGFVSKTTVSYLLSYFFMFLDPLEAIRVVNFIYIDISQELLFNGRIPNTN